MMLMLFVWTRLFFLLERFRAGHFTCKNTDWENWREPIRKVEPETTDWALHTRIPVRIEPSHLLTAAECWSIGLKILKVGIFTSAFLFFLLFFFCFRKMTRSMIAFSAPDVFPIYVLIYLFKIFFACHAAVVVLLVVTGFILKRLFTFVTTVCLEVGRSTSAVKHHRSSLEYDTAILSYLESDRN